MYSGHNISFVNSSENNYYCNDNILTQYKNAWSAYAFIDKSITLEGLY